MLRLLTILLSLALNPPLWAEEETAVVAWISLDDATKQVLKDGNQRVLSATTINVDGKQIHVIKVLTPDGRIKYIKINAETGSPVS